MRLHPYLNTFAVRNLFGLLAVLLAHYIPDYYHLCYFTAGSLFITACYLTGCC
jgi:hypothetical protein